MPFLHLNYRNAASFYSENREKYPEKRQQTQASISRFSRAFRSRLLAGSAEMLLLEGMLEHFKTQGQLKARGKQRTDSTHVLAAIRTLNQLENVGETFRATLNTLASVASEWLHEHAESSWFDRYSYRIEESRLPKGQAERQKYAEFIGSDGSAFSHWCMSQ